MSRYTSLTQMVIILTVCVIATRASRAAYINAVSASNPIAVYHMDESSGTTMFDSQNANNGTYGSGVTLNAVGPQSPNFFGMGLSNPAASFNGSTTSSAIVSAVSGLSTTTYSMEAWFNYSSTKLQYLIGRGSGASLAYDSVGLNNTGLGFFNGHETNTFGSPVGVSQNAWHQLVFTRNGTSVNIYVDGASVISVTSNNFLGTSTRIVVGGRPGDDPAEQLHPTALFDEVSLYNTELTASQVLAHYTAALPEPASLALLGLAIGCVQVRRRVR